MNTIRILKKIIAGAVLSGGLAVAAVGLAADTAQVGRQRARKNRTTWTR